MPSSIQREQAMALWLCRLESDGLAAVGRDDDRARELGIGAWVLPIQVAGEDDVRWESIQRCFALPSGLPLLLEWVIDGPCSLAEEQALTAQLPPWLASQRALPLEQRPALLIQGTHHLDAAERTAQRLRRSLASALGRIPLLLNGSAEPPAGFDGNCDWIAPLRADSPADQGNYEVHLRQAHWRAPPQRRSIPAVRAPTADDDAGMSGATPQLYRSWLSLLSRWSELLANGDPQAPVLIDSWSGHQVTWSVEAEDSATRPAAGVAAAHRLIRWGEPSADRLALMVHGYYMDGLAAILNQLPDALLPEIDIYVSTPLERLPAAAAVLRRRGCPVVRLFGVPNRGRDIAPFLLQLLPAVLGDGHHGFIKLHTKASPHLADGEDWGDHLIKSLLDPSLLQGLREQLRMDPKLGLLAPAGTRVPITLQLQNNGRHLLQLQRRTGLQGVELLGANFIAGSMLAGRVELLKPLVDLGQQLSDFEAEAGQTDGTLAHALERWIGVLAHQQGLRVDELPGDGRAMPGFGYRWSQHLGSPDPTIRMGTSQTQPLQGFPLIDSPLFKAHRQEGVFGEHRSIADQLHERGYAVVDLGRERMQSLADRIQRDLGAEFDLQAWRDAGGQASLRVQDAWQHSEAVRELALLPEIAAMLQVCWGRQPFAFQTLNFPVGTQQHLHSNAMHFQSEPPGFMCGVWVALEDIHPDSGPLEYVPGSQRLPYLQAADVGVQQQPGVTPDQTIFHDYWQAAVASDGFQRETFTPRLGQALIWSANLIHGGSAVENLQRTRWSQVTHYFFEGCRHYTPMLSDWPEGPVAWRNPFDIARGCERGGELQADAYGLEAVQALAAAHGWTLQKLLPGALEEIEHALLEEAIASREAGAAAFSLALMEWALAEGFTSPWLQDNRARALVHLQRLEEACVLWRELAQPPHSTDLRSAASEMLERFGQHHQLKASLVQGDLDAANRCLDPLLQQGQEHGPRDWQALVASVDRQGLMPLLLPLLEARLESHPSQGLFRLIDALRLLRGAVHLDQLLRVSQEQLLAFGWRADGQPVVLLARTSTGRWLQADAASANLGRPDVAEQLQLPALDDAGFLASLRLEPGESLTQLWLQGHAQPVEIRDLRGLPYLGVVDQLLQLCQPGLTPLERAPALFEAGIGGALQQLAMPLKSQEHWQGLIERREHFGAVAPEAEITVVIPLYRRWDFILGHVAGFCRDPWFVDQRVRLLYVIDDPAITTEVLGWCRGQLSDELLDVAVIALQRNSGFALACNSGVLAADTPEVCLLNSDVLPIQPGWLQPLFSTRLMVLEAMVAPLLLTDEGRIQHAGMTAQPLGLGDLPACVHSLKGLDPQQIKALSPDGLPYDVELLSGAALMFERKRFLELGGFNPVFGRGDFEDLDFSLRWRQAGGRLQLVPSALLTHLERQSIIDQHDPLTQWRGVLNAWQSKQLCPELA